MTAINVTARRGTGATVPPGSECEVIQEFLGIEAPCGNPAAGLFTRICVHEHLRKSWLCAYHAENSGQGLCRDCDQLPGGLSHDCPIAVAQVTR